MQRWQITLFLVLAVILSGCSFFAKAPMDVLNYSADGPVKARTLIVFMRGMGGSHRSFNEEGMVDEVRKRRLAADMAAPDAHFGYYSGRTLITRLREDVILPAKAAGYRDIWLVGISMGGLGSLLYLREHPEDISGVYLISPFLGYDEIIDAVEDGGGAGNWLAPAYDPADDWQTMLWDWISTEVFAGRTPPVYLGFGRADSYSNAQRLLKEALPAENTIAIEGGHDYPTFKSLWRIFLNSDSPLQGKI